MGAFDWPADAQLGDLPGGGNMYDRGRRTSTPAGAVAHFLLEAVSVAREEDDALLGDAGIRLIEDGIEVTVNGQRFEVVVRAARPGMYLR